VDCLCSCVLLSLPHCVASRWAARSSTFYSSLGDGCWTSLETKLLLALRHHNESFRPTVTWLLAKLSQGSRNNRPHRYITWPISLCKKKRLPTLSLIMRMPELCRRRSHCGRSNMQSISRPRPWAGVANYIIILVALIILMEA